MSIDGLPDPDAEAKDRWEAELAALCLVLLGELWRDLRGELPPGFWQERAEQWKARLQSALLGMAQEAQKSWLEREESLGLDWGVLGSATLEWARRYCDLLVSDLLSTSRHLWEADHGGMSDEEFYAWLGGYFGEVRADLIATTETTSGFWHGQDIMAGLLIAQGFKLEPIWQTALDERVCSVCFPNHGVPRSQGWTVPGLPAHQRCRCYVNWRLII